MFCRTSKSCLLADLGCPVSACNRCDSESGACNQDAHALNACNGVTGGDYYVQWTVSPAVHVSNPCFVRASDSLVFIYGSGVLSIELPFLTAVGSIFQVTEQVDVTRVVLSELRTVGHFEVTVNPVLTYLSAPIIGSALSVIVCGNSEAFSLPSNALRTWPATNPAIGDQSSLCAFQAGNAECSYVSCSELGWPSTVPPPTSSTTDHQTNQPTHQCPNPRLALEPKWLRKSSKC